MVKKCRKEGREKGIAEGRAEVAKNLIKIKMPIEQIIETTGLSQEEVKELSKSLKEKVVKKEK